VLEDGLEPSPPDTEGEVFLGGDGLALGYLGDPISTAENFLPDPYSPVPGARMFRTGDRGVRRSGGTVEFCGRSDGQAKIRGYRVDLAEVEAALNSSPWLAGSAVRAFETGVGQRLVAYLHPVTSEPLDERELGEFVGRQVPDYMIPSRWVMMADGLPLSAGGKVDRKRLRAPVDGWEPLPSSPDAATRAGWVPVVNEAGQSSRWPRDKDLPPGWRSE
jgi:acyl-CoA synthetase (AMP-forming)/AMP-acid ligase II